MKIRIGFIQISCNKEGLQKLVSGHLEVNNNIKVTGLHWITLLL